MTSGQWPASTSALVHTLEGEGAAEEGGVDGLELHFEFGLGWPLICLFSQNSFFWPETPLCCHMWPLGYSSWVSGYMGSSMRQEGQEQGWGWGWGWPRNAGLGLAAVQEAGLLLSWRCWGFLACCGFLPVWVSAESPCRFRGNLASQKWA